MKHNIKTFLVTMVAIFIFILNAYGAEMVNMKLTYDGKEHNYSAGEIILIIDGRELRNLPMPPIILNDYTLVPAREVFEQLGATVEWSASSKEIHIEYLNDIVLLQIDNTYAIKNGKAILMEVPPKIINGKTMIPLRFASEALGFKVGWNGPERIATVDSHNTIVEEKNSTPAPTEVVPNAEIKEPVINTGGNAETPKSNVVVATDISSQTITEEEFPETMITSLDTPTVASRFVSIYANSEITKVDKFLLEGNRLVIDIYNSEMQLPKTEYTPESTSAVKKIRTAQNQMEPVKVTRIVMELESGVSYSVSLSEDRKTVKVDFEQNKINNVEFSSDGTYDYITITGDRAINTEASMLSNPDRLVMDFPSTAVDDKNVEANGKYTSAVKATQVDNKARVTVDLKGRVKYSKTVEGNKIIYKLEEPTYKNVSYDNDKMIITLKKDNQKPIDIKAIAQTDNYINYQYQLTLPGDFTSIYGYGDYEVNDNNIKSFTIETSGGNTHFVINEKRVFAVVITEDTGNIYINIKSPKEVYSKIIILDPGHGGSDPGTSGQGHQEKGLTLDISQRVLNMLEQNYSKTGIKVYTTRIADVAVSRFDRAPFANDTGGDLFVSIHLNSASPNETPHGTETYYHPHDNDNTIGITTKETADIFHKNFLARLGSYDRKVKQNSYTVLLDTKMPSVLCEIGFLSNVEEGQKLLTEEYRQIAAEAIYASILEVFTVYTPKR